MTAIIHQIRTNIRNSVREARRIWNLPSDDLI